MTDVLIRDVPEDVLQGIDARAAGLGLSRSEYLRRELAGLGRRWAPATTRADLDRLAQRTAELRDPVLRAAAWE